MIDIVNAESSAIVNLSSDLKILQNKFANITTPLGQFKEEVTVCIIFTGIVHFTFLCCMQYKYKQAGYPK